MSQHFTIIKLLMCLKFKQYSVHPETIVSFTYLTILLTNVFVTKLLFHIYVYFVCVYKCVQLKKAQKKKSFKKKNLQEYLCI